MHQTKQQLLIQNTSFQAIHIDQNDMIHITWKHVTIRLNVTGLIYLSAYLDGDQRHKRCAVDFQIFGTPDDGYQLWIQEVGLRLSVDDFQQFKRLLQDGLAALRRMGKAIEPDTLPDYLKLTVLATPMRDFSCN